MRIIQTAKILQFALLSVLITAPFGYARDQSLTEAIRHKVELLREVKDLQIGDIHVSSVTLLPQIYEKRNFNPLWTQRSDIEALFAQAAEAHLDGLNPNDYHLTYLQFMQLEAEATDPSDFDLRADFDILLTESLIRLYYHLIFGKVDPVTMQPEWNMTRDIDHRDPAQVISETIEAHLVGEKIENRKPDHVLYRSLKAKLAEYRRIAEKGGWKPIPATKAFKKDAMGPQVEALRARLTLSGDLTTAATLPDVFDQALEQAVKTFQKRHMLHVDGIVGKNTLAAMNVPVEKRIDQIRVNLERLRWVSHQIPESFVVADLAGSEVYYIQRDEVAWQASAQVGGPCRELPCFRADIRYMVINPTWTIPPKIVAEDILPAVKRDSTYLKKRAIRVLNRHGDGIDPKRIKWSGYPERNFPYVLQQDSGPDNVLGRLKFVFPNPYRATIHDRPAKSLFKASESGFSSGCIGVERPFELAQFLLGDPDKWGPETLQKAAASQKGQTVFLPTPIPVLLLYLTAHVNFDGTLIINMDVHNRDDSVLKALESTFAFQPD